MKKGVDLEGFCKIYVEEAEQEGIRAEVAFCQAMLETGWLQFGGSVKLEQYNFAGIGATGGDVEGAKFNSIQFNKRRGKSSDSAS